MFYLCLTGFFALQVALDFVSYRAPAAATVAIAAGVGALCLLSPRRGLVTLLVLVVLSDDTTRLPGVAVNSILITSVGGFTLVVGLVLLLLVSATLHWLLVQGRPRWRTNAIAPVIYFGALVIPAIIGLPALASVPRIYVHDAAYLIVPLAGYVAVRAFYPGAAGVRRLGVVLIAAICARAVWGLVTLFRGEGYTGAGELVFVLSSTRDLFPVAWIALLALYAHRRALRLRSWPVIAALALVLLVNIASNISQFNMAIAVVGALAVAIGSRHLRTSYGRNGGAHVPVLPAAAIMGIALVALALVAPGSLQHVFWEISNFDRVPLAAEDLQPHSEVRVLEFVNIVGWLAERQTIWLGEGFGGWFADTTVPYSRLYIGATAYADATIMAGTLYEPHDNVNVFLLKGGVIGLLAWGVSTTLLAYRTFVASARNPNVDLRAWGLAISILIPILAYKVWSSALLLVWGIIMAMAVALYDASPPATRRSTHEPVAGAYIERD